jgi:tetratricopeptide (TPR) repeat protein
VLDFEHPETLFALKCSGFWKERNPRIRSFQSPVERGDYILSQWKSFAAFLSRLGGDFERTRYAFRRYVFGLALREYLSVPEEDREGSEAALEFRLGRCRKFCGDYDAAIMHLQAAATVNPASASILAEYADTRALAGELRASKALFREAFYLDPEEIDLAFLESEMITRLAARIREDSIEEPLISEWIPVFGAIFGVFSVKRELRQMEVSRLRQSISDLEMRLRDSPAEAARMKPRLLNRYFWLMDHYTMQHETKSKSDEVLLKIRLLDPAIHTLYTA